MIANCKEASTRFLDADSPERNPHQVPPFEVFNSREHREELRRAFAAKAKPAPPPFDHDSNQAALQEREELDWLDAHGFGERRPREDWREPRDLPGRALFRLLGPQIADLVRGIITEGQP